jgi:protein-S-isoprenylcysteine O-methyltransferase Ste14
MVTRSPHAHVRHPQYVGFILIMVGFLFRWPTLITLLVFRVPIIM